MTPMLGIMASQISGHLANVFGTTWTAGGTLPSTANWRGAVYGNNIFYTGINASGTTGASSPTGATWTSRTVPTIDNSGTVFGNSIFMAFGYGNTIATSSDGITWSSATASGINNPEANCYGLSAFVVGEYLSTSLKSSVNNGSSWTTRTSSAVVQRLAGSSSLVVGNTNGSTTTVTTDLATWTTGAMPSSTNWYGIAYGNGIFVSVSITSGTKAAYSTDGLTWTASTLPATSGWTICGWTGANWIALGNNGQAATSLDAITWTSRSIATLFSIQIGISPTTAVAVNYGGSTSQRSTS